MDPESNNSIDFNVMIHRIHMGKDLPSVVGGKPYSIVGNGLTVHDWSHAGFPQQITNCQVCHTQADGDRWYTNGTRSACVSCHDNIFQVHPVQLNESQVTTCTNGVCHSPNGQVAPNALDAHASPLNRPATPAFDVRLVSVTATVDTPAVVRFAATVGTRATFATDAGTGAQAVTDPASFSLLEAFINGPNGGFQKNGNNLVRVPKDMLVNLAAADVPGEFTFSLPQNTSQLLGLTGAEEDSPDPSTHSYTLTLRAQYDPTPGAEPNNDRIDMRRNPSMAFSPTAAPRARVAIVSTENCKKCHGDLTAHGGANLAKNVEQCVMCHTGSLDTRVRQGVNKVAGPTTPLRFATLIHRIHGGAIAQTPYRVYGFTTMPPYPVVDFSELGFPGDAKVCTTCHLTGTYFLPLPEGDPPTRTVSLDANGAVIP